MKQDLLFFKNRLKHFKKQKFNKDYYCTLVQVDLNPLKFYKVFDFHIQDDYINILENNNNGRVITISHSNASSFKILEDTPTLQVLYSKVRI
jgi:hypothetical protein